MTYETDKEDRQLAWYLYVQLVTRKAAVAFDEKHDIIADVYDSWYDVFQMTREALSKHGPPSSRSSREITELILRVINDGLRPHLTKWQACLLYTSPSPRDS